ncbi:phosphate acyltransferase PlsX [Herbivorax sp. ANBcel31]|uniref:phosphate acyltransferase PlsX n=1 Tax=Herbivorax sp. ANBcel31 TaxID=3069754 RepID=UPI0027B0830B|nr:phosphate acyltransferase PlsX [Herbivorax sp. ANBcel31]MDQ2085255.1 phosphate acyltransferase PlsX [Herbivorax sp. ANBcel31]
MIILVDAMGGDSAPDSVVNGCIDAVNEVDGFEILLLGDKNKITEILDKRNFNGNRIKIRETSEVITVEDVPTRAIKTKKDSSMVVGFKMLKEKKGDIFVSCGNSGALMAGALLILGRTKGVDRPSLAAMIPTKKGKGLIIDAGLNTTCKPINYQQFGVMGSIYSKAMLGLKEPRVGLVNIGSEEGKGNEVLKQAHNLLSNSNVNFVGNIEGNDVMIGKVDVIVCDGFTGNVLLKFLEGAASFFMGALKNIFNKGFMTKLSGLMIKSGIKKFKKGLDAEEHGGAPILGVNGLVLKSHGNSSAKTVKNVVIKASRFASENVLKSIKEEFSNMEVENIE